MCTNTFILNGYSQIKLIPTTSGSLFHDDDTLAGAKGVVLAVDTELITTGSVKSYSWRSLFTAHNGPVSTAIQGANADALAFGGVNSPRIFVRTHDATGTAIGIVATICACEVETNDGVKFSAPFQMPTAGVDGGGDLFLAGFSSHAVMAEQGVTDADGVKFTVNVDRPLVQEMKTISDIDSVVFPELPPSAFNLYTIENGTNPMQNYMMQNVAQSGLTAAQTFAPETLTPGFYTHGQIKTLTVTYEQAAGVVNPFHQNVVFMQFNGVDHELRTVYSFVQ